jgi:hypothetical protein
MLPTEKKKFLLPYLEAGKQNINSFSSIDKSIIDEVDALGKPILGGLPNTGLNISSFCGIPLFLRL